MAKPEKTVLLVELVEALSCGMERNRPSIIRLTTELLEELTPRKLMEEVQDNLGNRTLRWKDRNEWMSLVTQVSRRIHSTIPPARPIFPRQRRQFAPPLPVRDAINRR